MNQNYNASPYPSGGSGFQNLGGLFPVRIGSDVSGTFALSLHGLAVIRPDGRAVVHRDGVLLDVTLFLLSTWSPSAPWTGINPCACRVPVSEVGRGDLIVTSDCPLSLLYVLEQTPAGVRGLDPFTGNIVKHSVPLSPFFNYYVRVQSLFGRFLAEMGEPGLEEEQNEKEAAEEDEDEGRDRYGTHLRSLLSWLLLNSAGQNASSSLMTLLLMQALEGRL